MAEFAALLRRFVALEHDAIALDFAAHRLSLLDRGFIYAVIHVRGGGELGSDWHRGDDHGWD